ncbi:MAG TPA: hypothetical protein VGN64_07050 [Dyadobacter sp.]|jgi:hypothetical protein|nr:hypothetical protein [Dyadobacter sp.]
MKLIHYCLIVLVLSGSCKNKTPKVAVVDACGVEDPVRNLGWLKGRINEAKASKTDQFLKAVLVNIDGKQVINCQFEYMACVGCYAYNCDGSPFDISKLTDAERTSFYENVWGEKGIRTVLWPQNEKP